MRPYGLDYTDVNDAGVEIEINYYATQKWVNAQISGAISASY